MNKENKTSVKKETRSLLEKSDTAYIGLMAHSFEAISNVLGKRKGPEKETKEEEVPLQRSKRSVKLKLSSSPKQLGGLQGFLKEYKCKVSQQNKNNYFNYLKKNQIIDTTDRSDWSMHRNLSPAQAARLSSPNTMITESMTTGLSTIFSHNKPSNSAKAKTLLEKITSFKAQNAKERAQRAISIKIIEMHIYKSYMFSQKFIKSYSELDFVIKFWSPVIEEYLNCSALCLHWGETKAKKTKTDAKLDLRVLSSPGTNKADITICEFAKTPFSSKLYYDKLKSVLLTKYQLNSWISAGISPKDIRIPIIQVMGLVFQVMVLRLEEKGVYVLQPVSIFRFPSSLNDIQDNGIQTLINNLDKIKTWCMEIKALYNNASHDKEKKKLEKLLGNEEGQSDAGWTTHVVWFKEGYTEESDESEEDDESESSENSADNSEYSDDIDA